MEKRTEFDLNATIQRWRENLSQSPQFRAENVQELESHLRDAVAMWQSKGLSGEEAFLIAARRLGNAPSLEPEFAKVNGKEVWIDRVLWMVIGVQLLWVLSSLSSGLAETAVVLGLAKLGYHFKWSTSAPYASGIAAGTLIILVQLSILGLGVWGSWRVLRQREEALSAVAGRLLRYPLIFGLVVVVGVIMARSIGTLHVMVVAHSFGPEKAGLIQMSKSFASVFGFLATTVAFAGLTVFLARRRLRLRTNK